MYINSYYIPQKLVCFALQQFYVWEQNLINLLLKIIMRMFYNKHEPKIQPSLKKIIPKLLRTNILFIKYICSEA